MNTEIVLLVAGLLIVLALWFMKSFTDNTRRIFSTGLVISALIVGIAGLDLSREIWFQNSGGLVRGLDILWALVILVAVGKIVHTIIYAKQKFDELPPSS